MTPTEFEELVRALRRHHGGFFSTQDARTYAEHGWTAGAVETIRRLARWAIDQDTDLAVEVIQSGGDIRNRTYHWLESLTDPVARSSGIPMAAILPWTALAAAATDRDARNRVERLMSGGMRNLGAGVAPDWSEFTSWAAQGTIGPRAFASGLTLAEAHTALDEEHTQLLAGLRGYRFPLPS